MDGIVDFHSHILPGIDDGSASVEESIAMLQLESGQGIGHVVATPHFYPRYETPEVFLRKRDQAESALMTAAQCVNGLPKIHIGAEVYFFRGISETEALPQLTIRGKNCILIEMPPAPWPESFYQELEAIWHRWGITPIIAHIDRYIAPFRTHGIPQRLQQLPVLVQANASFFLRRRTRRMALKMLRGDQIQLLGSDCHNLSNRPPNLGDTLGVLEKQLGQSALAQLKLWQDRVLLDEINDLWR